MNESAERQQDRKASHFRNLVVTPAIYQRRVDVFLGNRHRICTIDRSIKFVNKIIPEFQGFKGCFSGCIGTDDRVDLAQHLRILGLFLLSKLGVLYPNHPDSSAVHVEMRTYRETPSSSQYTRLTTS